MRKPIDSAAWSRIAAVRFSRRGILCHIFALLVTSPLAGEAQQTSKIARIGYLSPLSAAGDSLHREAFREGLRAIGYVEGQNAVIEARYADDSIDKLPGLAVELVRLKVDVIVAAPSSAIRAAQQATRTIPIVMAFSGDPVGEGLVAALRRPGGNITGHSAAVAETAGKRMEFLKAIVPKLSHVAFLVPPAANRINVIETEAAGRILGVQVMTRSVRSSSDVKHAFSAIRDAHVAGVIVALALRHHWKHVLDLSFKSRLPTISGPREFVEAGGLMAYGPHYPDLFRRAATYVDKILKGANPADLPVEQPTKFEFVINRKTADALGVTIPASLLLQADHVIER